MGARWDALGRRGSESKVGGDRPAEGCTAHCASRAPLDKESMILGCPPVGKEAVVCVH